MGRKYSILPGIIILAILLLVAARYYPLYSHNDKNSIGNNWKNNNQDNLFNNKVIDEPGNPSGPWAIGGMFFLFHPGRSFTRNDTQ